MKLSRRHFLAGGTVLVAGAAVGLASRPSVRGSIDAGVKRAEVAVARRTAPGASGPPSSVTITVDPSRVLRPISPLIYGVAHASPDQLVALGAQLNRWGGNPNTRYNWMANAWNAARDWEFRNYGDDPSKNEPAGFAADQFVKASQSVGVETAFTVPAMGWVSRNADKSVQSVGVPSEGGAPIGTGSDAIAGYNPATNRRTTSVPSYARRASAPQSADDAVYQDEFIRHLVNRYGTAENGGVRYYIIDNEPDLWSSTHTDVHPVQMGYDNVLSTFIEYASAIKAVDPSASVAGPALSGWTGYFYSALDRSNDNYHTHRDRQAHGDMAFLPWWLDQVRKHDEQVGMRTLDVLDVHFYPQSPNVFSAADDAVTRSLRARSTRALWDPHYVDESWINDTVQLVPRMTAWIDQYYPGTKLAIGEWSWGGEKSMSGALAIADVLGIYGREGVDMGSYWTFPPVDSLGAQAFALFSRYNDRGDAFGDQAIPATVDSSPDYVTSYASIDSATGDAVVVALNKRFDAPVSASITLIGAAGPAEVYRLSAATPSIQPGASFRIGDAAQQLELPPASATLLRVPMGRSAST